MIKLRSKTHVFGILLGTFGGFLAFLPEIKDMISEDMYGYIFMGCSVAVIVLRNVTNTPIEDK